MSSVAGLGSPTGETQYHQSNARTIYIPVGVFLAICPIVVAARIWARVGCGLKLGADDFIILFSLAFALASDGVMLAACQYGYGKHIATLSPDYRYQAFKYFYLCQVTYKACINSTKASILFLYLRIFGNTKWFRLACRVMLVCVILYFVASVTATICQCVPITKAFDKSLEGTCIDNGRFWYANAGFSIASDVIILTLPMPLVYALQVPRVQKVALVMVFALGVFVIITSCLRVTTLDFQAKSPDPTYDIASTMWTVIEMNVAIVCACLPQIRPLIIKCFPRAMPSYYADSREHSDKHCYTADHLPRSILGSNMGNNSKSDEGSWARIDNDDIGRVRRDDIALSNLRKGGSGSEEYILQDDKGLQIQKTVQYSVEYSSGTKANSRAQLT
ncbi:uncharacterized protein F4822DRAFT_414886 [Hypoxylon trugodes]|uniref:uncharacterized protein n=1 Tax=Hypoxylon trugodes TaxID=326681 RepID=UPI00218D75BB|nr:uncharacterized protein F4822DRAFT_414886 [Hypoxylon trugodes]KAI1384364.1 hypothetical protein F4822DRAFT_414886 [Hypoxylon trugodes]